jgi:hypothetical protein
MATKTIPLPLRLRLIRLRNRNAATKPAERIQAEVLLATMVRYLARKEIKAEWKRKLVKGPAESGEICSVEVEEK